MNKADLVSALAAEAQLTKTKAAQLIDTTFGIITTQLGRGEEVDLHGFGKFEVTEKPERPGVNPATGEKITIKASKNVKFKAQAALKRAL